METLSLIQSLIMMTHADRHAYKHLENEDKEAVLLNKCSEFY
jgi:hypothetical protein